jgi:uncharacterized protein
MKTDRLNSIESLLKTNKDEFEKILKIESTDFDIKDQFGNSALYYACKNSNKIIARKLKFEGAKFISSPDTYINDIIQAAKIGDLNIVKMFYNSGADFKAQTSDRKTLLGSLNDIKSEEIKEYLANLGIKE